MASKEETVAATKRVLRCVMWCVMRCVMWCVMRCLMWCLMRCLMRCVMWCVIDKQLIIKQYRTYL